MIFDRGSNSIVCPGPAAPLPAAANVVIIGGGVMGVSIACHLARAGVRDVVLIEKNRLGSGSSAKPLGGVRATFSDPGNIMLGQRSLEAFERFSSGFGADIGLRQVGYLFLAKTESELASLESSTELQNTLGGSGRMVSPGTIADLSPFIDANAVLGGSFSARDGFAEPSRVVAAYAAAAREAGVVVAEHTEVLALEVGAGAVTAVETSHGRVRPDVVVCAVGAWAARVGRMAGVDLPVEPVRRQVGFTPALRTPMPVVPFTLDLGSTLYFHNAGDGLLLGISDAAQEPGFGREFSFEWVAAFDRAAEIVAPALVGAPIEAGWAGLYENTPDHNALIGTSSEVANFHYAVGFSGHGFLQAPAVGELMADTVLGRDSFMDASGFSADRFARSGALTEIHII